jgi:hypothetical protein
VAEVEAQVVAQVAHLDEDLVEVPVAQWAQWVLVVVDPEWPVVVAVPVVVAGEVNLKLALAAVEVVVAADNSLAVEAVEGQLTSRAVVVRRAAAAIRPAATRAMQAALVGEDGVLVEARHRLVRVVPAANPLTPMVTQ